MIPFTRKSADSVAALGEAALLRAIRGWLGDVSPPPPFGIGDDCAVLEIGGKALLLATTDGVVYGRHFDETHAPATVGAKLLKRNLSDVAAMGGTPRHALINLLLGRDVATAWLEQFYAGLAKSCREFDVTLAGGDLAQGPDGCFAAHLTLLGIPGKAILTRTGARLGDHLFVTGELGGSILGKHLDFTPRLAEGQWLAANKSVRALIDVTDGLAKDLPEILPPGADARLTSATLPISPAAHTLASRDKRTPLSHALTDGEDYELLFAVNARIAVPDFLAQWRAQFPTPLSHLGIIAPALDPINDRQLRHATSSAPLVSPGEHGYEHLR